MKQIWKYHNSLQNKTTDPCLSLIIHDTHSLFAKNGDQNTSQVMHFRRLRQKVNHPWAKTPLPFFFGWICSQCNNHWGGDLRFRWSAALLFSICGLEQLQNWLCCIESVHYRHVDIHEYDFEHTAWKLALDLIQRQQTISSQFGLNPVRLEHSLECELVEFVIINNQWLFASTLGRQSCYVLARQIGLIPSRWSPHWLLLLTSD